MRSMRSTSDCSASVMVDIQLDEGTRDWRDVKNPTSDLRLRLLAVMEATTVTGAARSMLEYCRAARDCGQEMESAKSLSNSLPNSLEISLVTFDRRPEAQAMLSDEQQKDISSEQPAPNEFVAAARRLGIEVDIVHERFRFDPRVFPQLRNIVGRRRPDIIVTHHVKSHFLLKQSGLWKQAAWAAFHHGYTTTDLKMRAYNQLDRWSLPTAHRVITVCEAFARKLSKAVPPEKISVQHNSIRIEPGASDEEAAAVRSHLGVRDDERLLLVIGRLSREKAQADLLQAFGLLHKQSPELKAKLLIIGDGPERSALETATSSMGLSQLVIFAGQLSGVDPYYRAADVMALPSHSEGSPYVLLEAMGARLPVVATAVGGVPEMVTDGETALLVPPREPQAMARALHRVLHEDELAQRLAGEAFKLVSTRFSPEAYLQRLTAIYCQTVAEATAKRASVSS